MTLEVALRKLYDSGHRTVTAAMVARVLWPKKPTGNASSGFARWRAATAGRMLRRSLVVHEVEIRRWQTRPMQLPATLLEES